MKQVIRFSLLLGIIAVFLFLSSSVAETKESTDLEAMLYEMSIEELEESKELLLRILNEKRIAGAKLFVDPSSAEIAVGKTVKLTVSSDGREITKTTKINYETADPAIADVKAGVVTAKGPGTVKIKASATFEDDAVLESFCDITVFVPVAALKTTVRGTVFTGEDLDIAALVTISPENATEKGLLYEVSDAEIATITEDGVLTGKKAGTVTVTITSKENVAAPKTAKLSVTVNQAVKSIELSDKEFNVGKGKTYQLKSTIGPDDATNKKVTWSSSNPKIASVSGYGTVTGVSTGTAIITCTAADGSGVSASAKVTVITSVSSLRVEKTQQTVIVGKTVSNKCTVSPNDATNKKLTWTSDNPSIASVSSSGVVTGKYPGTCKITATAADGSNVKVSYTVYVEPKVPIEIISVHWQTSWGVKDGRMGVEAKSKCQHATIKSFDYTVKCYIGSINSEPAVTRMTYEGSPIIHGGTGKSRLSSSSISGFRSASYVVIIPTAVYFNDGTYVKIENAEDYASAFDLR